MTAGLAARDAARRLPPWPAERPLRDWQSRACTALFEAGSTNFLASATPAAGKTTFGLRVAHELLTRGRVARVVVVAPTTHIARQWAADAATYGIDLEPNRPNAVGAEPRDRHGVCITYQTLAQGPSVQRAACARATLLIADEPHHMGENAAWGERALRAFEHARMRLLLSGTPFRSDSSPIPWVTYDDEGLSRADFTYGYTDALLDGVCRPITFQTYDGDMEWVSDGRTRRANFSLVLSRQEGARRLRTALDPAGDWMAQVLRDADVRLSAVRAAGHADAAGLVIASDKQHAVLLAAELEHISGERPEVVTSDEPDSSARIARFRSGGSRWLVSVLMVSEGVDIPRLRVGVYATAARTELFFRQVIGRFVRRTATPKAQMSYLLLAADARLKALAAQIEEERNHALVLEQGAGEQPEVAERNAGETAFRALSSSARPDEAITSSMHPGDELQLFADPTPAPSGPRETALPRPSVSAPPPVVEAAFERRERLRAERSRLVALISRRGGEAHRAINGRMNRATGAASVAAATIEQLERANELLLRELRGERPARAI